MAPNERRRGNFINILGFGSHHYRTKLKKERALPPNLIKISLTGNHSFLQREGSMKNQSKSIDYLNVKDMVNLIKSMHP